MFEEGDAVECQRLWSAVVLRALQDALEEGDGIDARRARQWIKFGGDDFRSVCEFAGIEPSAVQRALACPPPDIRVRPALGPSRLDLDAEQRREHRRENQRRYASRKRERADAA